MYKKVISPYSHIVCADCGKKIKLWKCCNNKNCYKCEGHGIKQVCVTCDTKYKKFFGA